MHNKSTLTPFFGNYPYLSYDYNRPTLYNFKIPRYGDLLQEVFFSFTLPNIWSPIREIFPPLPLDICANLSNDRQFNSDEYQQLGRSIIP